MLIVSGPVGQADGDLDGPVALVAMQSRFKRKNEASIPIFRLLADLPFASPLGEGLVVKPAGSPTQLALARREGFSRRFHVAAGDRERGAALTAEAGPHFDAAFTAEGEVGATDAGVQADLGRAPPPYDAEELDGVLEHLVQARAAIRRAAASLPPPPLPPAAAALARAAPPGARVTAYPPALHATLGSATLVVSVSVGRNGWFGRVAVTPAEPLSGAPEVVAEAEFGWWQRLRAGLAGRSELTTGDAKFDRRFAVRGSAAKRLLALLDAPTRAAMLALDEVLPSRLHPRGVVASGKLDEAQVEGVVLAATALAERLGAER